MIRVSGRRRWSGLFGWSRKLGGATVARSGEGLPDRLVLLPGGRAAPVELKKPKGGAVAPLQALRHRELNRMGFSTVVLVAE